MADADPDDPTAPTGRAGVDPLIAFPKRATGQTGQIERPGDQTPWWFVPGLCAVAVFFIGLLATINQDRASDRLAQERAVAASISEPLDEPPVGSQPVDITSVDGSAASTTDPRIGALPSAGNVRFGDEFPIEAQCEVQAPFDPVDTEFQVSSYFFFAAGGERQLIDRIFDDEGDRALLLDGSTSLELDEIGDAGGFEASFEAEEGGEFDVVVNPVTETTCGDRLVTNEPGQFAEPHTRIILDVCIDRTTDSFSSIVGLTSEGARFEILQAGGELAEIVFLERGGEVMRTTAPATILRNGDITSASGVVSEGVNDLDITIDLGTNITEAEARACMPSDRI